MGNILEIKDLNLVLNDIPIIKAISCSFPTNKISVIIGPSGAGKSSLLKSITRLLPATGTILYRGQDSSSLDIQQFRKEVVYVSQVPVVFPGSVANNINWGRTIWDLEPIDSGEQLKLVGLSPDMVDMKASDLSVGQQQRLHLARSLAVAPNILLLDEPASGLDAISKEVFEDLIIRLQRNHSDLSIIMITHDLEQAKRLADYAILLDKGEKKLEAVAETFFREVQDMTEAEMLEQLLSQEGSS